MRWVHKIYFASDLNLIPACGLAFCEYFNRDMLSKRIGALIV